MEEGYGQQYARLYEQHWWWRAREALLLDVLNALPLRPSGEVLDVGCGDGLFFRELERFGRVRGIEVDQDLLDPQGPYRSQISTELLGHPQYKDWRFSLITALDVLEHIDDDRSAAAAIGNMLEPGGYLVATVPAFMSLWDEHDAINHHRRRYTSAEFRRLLEPLGQIVQLRYWFHGLYLMKWSVAALNRRRQRKVSQHSLPSPWINSVMKTACLMDARLLAPFRLPFGTSVMAVVRKA